MRTDIRGWQRFRRRAVPLLLALVMGAIVTTAAQAAGRTNRISIQYDAPKSAEHQPFYDQLRKVQALERLQRLLSPIRFPRRLPLKIASCDGVSNAWYDDGVVTVCYEYLADNLKNAPDKPMPSGVTRDDVILGGFLDVFLHEVGHAVFDLLKVPVFGREEDAADVFSAYIILQLGKEDARRLILGTAYQYRMDVITPQVSLSVRKFSDEHSAPAQCFFNILCLAYGADQKMFAEIVDKGYLPKERAEGCSFEYEQAAGAFQKLIGPHIDKNAPRKSSALGCERLTPGRGTGPINKE